MAPGRRGIEHWQPHDNNDTLKKANTPIKIANWSPYIFTLVLKVKIGLCKIHASINEPKLCPDSAGYFI